MRCEDLDCETMESSWQQTVKMQPLMAKKVLDQYRQDAIEAVCDGEITGQEVECAAIFLEERLHVHPDSVREAIDNGHMQEARSGI